MSETKLGKGVLKTYELMRTKTNEPWTSKEIQAATGLHMRTVQHHIEALRDAGLVAREVLPPTWQYYAFNDAIPEAEIQ